MKRPYGIDRNRCPNRNPHPHPSRTTCLTLTIWYRSSPYEPAFQEMSICNDGRTPVSDRPGAGHRTQLKPFAALWFGLGLELSLILHFCET